MVLDVERRGKQGEQYIDRSRRAVQGTEHFAPISAPVSLAYEKWRGLRRLTLHACVDIICFVGHFDEEVLSQRGHLHGRGMTKRFAPESATIFEVWCGCAFAAVLHP